MKALLTTFSTPYRTHAWQSAPTSHNARAPSAEVYTSTFHLLESWLVSAFSQGRGFCASAPPTSAGPDDEGEADDDDEGEVYDGGDDDDEDGAEICW